MSLSIIVTSSIAVLIWLAGRALKPSADAGTQATLGLMLLALIAHILGKFVFVMPLFLVFSITGMLRERAALKIQILNSPFRNRFLIALLITVIFSIAAIGNPLDAWDSRAIWFFHGKILAFAGGLTFSAGLTDPSLSYTHADYPKLLAILSGLLGWTSSQWGGPTWNEFFPRIATGWIYWPVLLALLRRMKFSPSSVYLGLFFIGIHGYTTLNGCMDSPLAVYFGIGLLAWLLNDREESLVFFMLCGLLKNEGIVLSLLGVGLWIFQAIRNRQFIKFVCAEKTLILGAAAILSWKLRALQWHLGNDLNIGSSSMLTQIFTRLKDHESLPKILSSLTQSHFTPLLLRLMILVGVVFFLIKPVVSRAQWLRVFGVMGITMAYLLTLIMVYLGTPHDLTWHLNTSAIRVMMPIEQSLIVLTAYVFFTAENTEPVPTTVTIVQRDL